MDRLVSHVRTDTPEYRENHARMSGLVKQLRDRVTVCRQGGGPRYLERLREQRKLPVRERIDRLLDPGSPFLELSPLSAWDLYDNEAPGAGILTGIGRGSGRGGGGVGHDPPGRGGGRHPAT